MRLIDADAIEYEFNIKTYGDNQVIVTSLLADKDTIDAMPTIEPKRKTGKWTIDSGIGCKCSNCGFDIGNDLDFMEYVNFCPHCGADMRGDSDG